jgi:glycine/D-amino acid oxidase-like deaminating enzyme
MAAEHNCADVVLVGPWIVGLTMASELARAGMPRVVVFDTGMPGQQSTGRSTGGIRRQFGSALEIRLSEEVLSYSARPAYPAHAARPALYTRPTS